MIRPTDEIRVHLCRDSVDFRKQMRGLSVLVQEELELDPFSQHLFAFCNRRKLRFLLSEVFNHVLLVSIDPAREDQHQKLQWQSVH